MLCLNESYERSPKLKTNTFDEQKLCESKSRVLEFKTNGVTYTKRPVGNNGRQKRGELFRIEKRTHPTIEKGSWKNSLRYTNKKI